MGHHHDHDHDGHHHDHHDHGHGHHLAPADFGRAFALGTALNIGFAAIELGYGFLAHSLALVADAAHNFSDVVGLLMAWAGHALSKRVPTKRHTYGFRRASILAGIANAIMLLGATGFIILEAFRRFIEPQAVATSTVVIVAVIGILLNGATALLFMRGRKNDINIQGAFLHMAADAGVSLGVVIGALLIAATGLQWIDPVVSLAIAAVILWSSWDLAAKALNLAMDAVPHNIDRDGIERYLAALPGVTEVHDLHIWAMGTTENALTAHLVRPGHGLDDAFLQEICQNLRDHYKIGHATIQIESGAHPCALAPAHVI
jgi:cobalt-zinc-cadmium efflux system protein